MTTTDLHPTLQEAFENLPDPDGLAKIIMQRQRSDQGETIGTLFARGDNGQVIAAVTGSVSQFGYAPHQETQYFTETHYALEYVKRLCRVYLGREDVDFLAEVSDNLTHLSLPNQTPRRRV